MPIAINPQTGETVFLGKDGAWQKAPTAVNPQTKETLAFDGEGWKPLPQQDIGMSGESVAPVDSAAQSAPSFASRFQGFKPIENSAGLERALMATAPIVRYSLLPFSKNTRTGESYFDSDAGLLGSIKRMVTLPGDVRSGKVRLPSRDAGVPGSISYEDPGASDAMGRVAELAIGASPTSVAGRTGVAAVSAAKKSLPEIDAIKSAASAAYKKADDAGVVLSEKGYSDLAGSIATSVRAAGFHPKIHPKVAGALEEISANIGKTPMLSELEITRRIAQSAAKSIERDERRVARIIIDKIDDFVQTMGGDKNMGGDKIIGGDAKAAASAITEARSLWRTAAKSDTIEQLMEKAANKAGQFSGSGYENAIRTVFRQFANNDKAMRGFSAEEKTAIRKVANGDKISNLFRYIGKAAPTGMVSAALGGGSGFAVGGPVGAVAVPLVGALARPVATKMTKNNVNAVRELVRGGKVVSPQVVEKSISRSRALFEDLFRPGMLTTSNQTGR